MKKIILFLIGFSAAVMAQDWDSNDSVNYSKKNDVVNTVPALGHSEYQLRGSIIYQVNNVYNILDSLKMGNDSTEYRDTVYIPFSEPCRLISLTLPDTTVGAPAHYTDSVKVYMKDKNTGLYTQIRLREDFSDSLFSVLVPGNGVTKTYVIEDKYPDTLMIIYANTGGGVIDNRRIFLGIKAVQY
jgi:hypothetical protein